MKTRRAPSEEERALFREAAAGARPLARSRVHHEPPPPPAVPLQRRRDEAAALAESLSPALLDLSLEGGDDPAFLRPGLARTVLRDLRRGRWVVQDQLDLHGATREEARRLVAEFLTVALRRGLRCVRIVHGKGLGSPGREPVLKGLVRGWLMQRAEVLAYCQARATEGGAGALVTLLKSQTPCRRD
ncbi:MAG: DNA mismatch repair protein MutS [Rhodocyclaceae bacterium]|nr:DNA mismatch repair protein MutS [Rhodocyclaceae bacterium]HNT61704.1 Smr/MutS family protein [Candidatus Desulfobacillus denitrificans]